MKVSIHIKKTVQVLIVIAIVLMAGISVKRIATTVKHHYAMQPAGSGMTCFYDIIQ